MRRKIAAGFFLVALAAACAAVWAGISENRFRAKVDAFAGVILAVAEDAELYYGALDAVESCVSGQSGVQKTVEQLEEARGQLLAVRAGIGEGDSGLDEEAAKRLEKAGFDREEARELAGRRAAGLEESIWSLESLCDYFRNLEEARFNNSRKTAWSRTFAAIKGTSRGLRYYGDINSRFLQLDERRTAYVKERILDRLPGDAAEPFAWEEDPLMVDRKLEICTRFREMYYDIGYPVLSCAELEKIRDGYREQAKENPSRVFLTGSWLDSLPQIRGFEEDEAYLEEAQKRREEYGDLYFDRMLEQ